MQLNHPSPTISISKAFLEFLIKWRRYSWLHCACHSQVLLQSTCSFLGLRGSHLSWCDPITHLRVLPNPPMPCATEPWHCVRGAAGEQTLLRNTSSTQKSLTKSVLFIQCVSNSHITVFLLMTQHLLSALCAVRNPTVLISLFS